MKEITTQCESMGTHQEMKKRADRIATGGLWGQCDEQQMGEIKQKVFRAKKIKLN